MKLTVAIRPEIFPRGWQLILRMAAARPIAAWVQLYDVKERARR